MRHILERSEGCGCMCCLFADKGQRQAIEFLKAEYVHEARDFRASCVRWRRLTIDDVNSKRIAKAFGVTHFLLVKTLKYLRLLTRTQSHTISHRFR
jgi:hypothetical protein